MGRSRRAVAAGLVGVTMMLFIGAWTSSAGASCAAPTATVEPRSGAAGESFTVKGKYFAENCADVIFCSAGSRCKTPETVPSRNIPIDFIQGKRVWHLGLFDGLDFVARLHVPTEATTGSATVSVGGECDGDHCLIPFIVTAGPAVRGRAFRADPDRPSPSRASSITVTAVVLVGVLGGVGTFVRRATGR